MKTIEELSVKIFSDGADKTDMLEMYAKPFIKGLTTNPTLMRKAGIQDYKAFAKDIYIKLPVSNTKQKPCYDLIKKLSAQEIKLNVTAIMTLTQVRDVVNALDPYVPSYVSVFAGRIADTGYDPLPLMSAAIELLKTAPAAELIWASPRELLNIFQADAIGCHIITVTNDILKKLSLVGRDLSDYSLDTVKMFYNDAINSNLKI